MATIRSLWTSSFLCAHVLGQAYNPGGREEGAFSYVQPLNTTILGPYGHSPAVLPSPNATGDGGWEAAFVKAQAFAAQLTVEEKADMVTGQPGPCVGNIVAIPRVGFNGLCLQDGPLAIRVADYASVFSAGVSAAATWDKDILYERGFAMGQEFRAKGAHVALTPVAGPLGRSGYAGRNWEGFAADPYLTGVAMELSINGIQDAGVQATPKHFIGNEQERQRNPTYDPNGTVTDILFEAISANIDDRTMHELYLWPFANAVRAKAASIMCAYQRLNGSYACENSKVQNGLLKEELGFQGYVMSDWGGTHSGVASIENGLDMNMPGGLGNYGLFPQAGSLFGGNLTRAINNGSVAESRVDDMIIRIMTPYYWLGQDKDFPTVDPSSADLNTFSPRRTWLREFNLTGPRSRDVRDDHGELIRKHGSAGTVLLKNENNALPLKAPKSIAIFGNDAGDDTQGFYNQVDFEYGTLTAGGGSGTGRLTYLVTPLVAIQNRAAQDKALVQYWLNNTLIVNSNVTDLWIPEQPDVCLVFLKTWAEEAADRQHLSVDWHGNEVVESVAKSCNNTIVVTHSSGINTLPFASHPNVTAILAAHFPGQESGNSLVDILYGTTNPSGHLPYTIALNGTDYNAPPTTAINTTGINDWQSWFDEKLEIDYRYFDAHNLSVRYEFGFGLSYTTFSLSDLAGSPLRDDITSAPEKLPVQPGGNPALWESIYNVTVSVSNTGEVAGAAVPQLYVGFPSATTPAGTPPRQLRGFDKVMLEVGETRTVAFELMRRDLSFWDVVSQQWVIPAGEFTLSVGLSSRDLRDFATITPVEA
ncbi:beta-glucosidase [Polyplosphaeria fusca]|uniref:Probable beta-glucosidase G n=1 Tax=Polyplosphaeria fusca TaxID=682080 RepID=A0A9P4R855_9PLEO|nr:beta-glucosidase [Polyplosphaeria fusca]